jgi:hypothetical protein
MSEIYDAIRGAERIILDSLFFLQIKKREGGETAGDVTMVVCDAGQTI